MVAGPEILEKYVGSSERNLRHIFDHPPSIHDAIRNSQPDYSRTLEETALHVIGTSFCTYRYSLRAALSLQGDGHHSSRTSF